MSVIVNTQPVNVDIVTGVNVDIVTEPVNVAVNAARGATGNDGDDYVAPFLIYRALLNTTGAAAPVPIVLQNTLGNITFEVGSTGQYRIVSNGLFTQNKTEVYFGSTDLPVFQGGTYKQIVTRWNSASLFYLFTLSTVSPFTFVQAVFFNREIEIRVYP